MYLLKRVDSFTYRTADGSDNEDYDIAQRWTSRLGARTELENEWPMLQLSYELVHIDKIPKKPEPPRYDGPLVITDPIEAVRLIHEAHHAYCDKLETWLRRVIGTQNFARPEPVITVVGTSWAGLYTSANHECHYPVAYAMINKDFLDITVAHEVVHAYQNAFTGVGSGHGGDFYALMRHAADRPVSRHTHTYSVEGAALLSAVIHPQWVKKLEQGELQSLPCEVRYKELPRDKKLSEGDVE